MIPEHCEDQGHIKHQIGRVLDKVSVIGTHSFINQKVIAQIEDCLHSSDNSDSDIHQEKHSPLL